MYAFRNEDGSVNPTQKVHISGIGDRELEGIDFVVEIRDGKLVCDSVVPEHKKYMEKYSREYLKRWYAEALNAAEYDEAVTEDGTWVYWGEE